MNPFLRLKKSLLAGDRIHRPMPGIYAYDRRPDGGRVRAHLRIEADGSGMLLVNASRIYHFNASAAMMAHLFLENYPREDCIAALTSAFHVSRQQAGEDFTAFSEKMASITSPEGACPICELEAEIVTPFSARPSAPYRMDLALTYRCINDCAHCYNAGPRQRDELNTAQWKRVLDQLWAVGIPHIVFTGGEPTLRPDLPELIAHAEANGQITGINTNGRRLKNRAYLDELVAAGLDHAQITLESHLPEVHDQMVRRQGAWEETTAGIRNALATRLFVMTNTTLLQSNGAPEKLTPMLAFLAELGVPTVGLNALIYSGAGRDVGTGLVEASLPPLLTLARTATAEHGQRLIWYTPTQYCHFDPIQMDLGVKGCTAALYNMCVEPDGGVIPCQSYYQSLGNLLATPWDAIWNHDLAVSLRERRNVPAACQPCVLLPECGGGCPLAQQAGRTAPPQTVYPLQF